LRKLIEGDQNLNTLAGCSCWPSVWTFFLSKPMICSEREASDFAVSGELPAY